MQKIQLLVLLDLNLQSLSLKRAASVVGDQEIGFLKGFILRLELPLQKILHLLYIPLETLPPQCKSDISTITQILKTASIPTNAT
jgi:hypothetical protein